MNDKAESEGADMCAVPIDMVRAALKIGGQAMERLINQIELLAMMVLPAIMRHPRFSHLNPDNIRIPVIAAIDHMLRYQPGCTVIKILLKDTPRSHRLRAYIRAALVYAAVREAKYRKSEATNVDMSTRAAVATSDAATLAAHIIKKYGPELPEAQRIVVWLFYVQHFTTGEIANGLMLHPATVSERRRAAVARLKKLVEGTSLDELV